MKILLGMVLVCVAAGTGTLNAQLKGKRLIKTSREAPAAWMDEDTVSELLRNQTKFMDVTGRSPPKTRKSDDEAEMNIPSSLQLQDQVKDVISKLKQERTEAFLAHFSSYHNRYYFTETGREAAEWLLVQIQTSIDSATDYTGEASVRFFNHTDTLIPPPPNSWIQPSVIARIEGEDSTLKSTIVILGAHLDSKNGPFLLTQPSPGADDNASGSSVLLETFRVLLDSNFVPRRTLEFQWYAAEEDGLLGSGQLAALYYNFEHVISMINFDVSGYFEGRREIGIMTGNTNRKLSALLRSMVQNYLSESWTWANMTCDYACSDHASFDEYDIPTAMPAPVVLNMDMHTQDDTTEVVNMEQLMEFTKLGVAYAIELSSDAPPLQQNLRTKALLFSAIVYVTWIL